MFESVGNYWWVLVLVLIPPAVTFLYRQKRSYRSLLTAELEKLGFEYVSEESPAFFDTGLFPKEYPMLSGKRSRILGIGSKWNAYRIVSYLDADKKEHKAWVRLRYEAFRLANISWRPKLSSRSQRKRKKRVSK